MSPQKKKEFIAIVKQLTRLNKDFSVLFAKTVDKRMPMEHAVVMDNIAFGLMLAETASTSMLDILNIGEDELHEAAKGSNKKKPQVRRRARLGDR